MEEELGARLPEGVRVVTVEETANTIYLVLPSTPTEGREDVALSDQELQSVSGGNGVFDTYTGQPYTCVSGGACEEYIDE